MKHFAPLFLIVLFSFSLSAQVIKPAEKTSEQTAEAWQDFMPAEEEFRLESPGTVTLRYVKTADDKLPPNRSYLALGGGTYYFVFSDPIDKPFQNQMVSGFVKSQVSADLQTDEIYSFDDHFGYHHTVLTMKNTARVYTFQSVSLSKTSVSVKRFFDSIRVKGNLERPTEKAAAQNSSPVSTSEDGTISLACSTLPDSSLQPPINSNSSTPGATTGVKTLTRPRASYTDFARSYQIEGSVQVRATFLASGKMGTVSTIKSLPFGLAVQGLQAACGLTFEPATKDGVPYTTVKQIIYNFSLF